MLKESVTPQDVVDLLNEIAKTDKEALKALINLRVPCNKALADHPTIQTVNKDGQYVVGILGILNGLFGVGPDHYGCLSVVEDGHHNVMSAELRLPKDTL